MNLNHFEQKSEAKIAAITALSQKLSENKDEDILFLFSGGSSLEILPEEINDEIFSKLTIAVLDERFSSAPENNNFLQFKETNFYSKAYSKGSKFFESVPSDKSSLDEFAMSFAEFLTSWTVQYPSGKIFATVGMGADGHTAGIMPYPEDPTMFNMLFGDPAFWVRGYDAGNKTKIGKRVTTTNVFLKTKIDFAVAYVVGEEKKDAFSSLLSAKSNIHEIPARVWYNMKEIEVFTDIN